MSVYSDQDSQDNLFHDYGCDCPPQTLFIYLFIKQIFMESLVKGQPGLENTGEQDIKTFLSHKIHILFGKDAVDEQTNIKGDGESLKICEQGVA